MVPELYSMLLILSYLILRTSRAGKYLLLKNVAINRVTHITAFCSVMGRVGDGGPLRSCRLCHLVTL